jgi:hypothetical protein
MQVHLLGLDRNVSWCQGMGAGVEKLTIDINSLSAIVQFGPGHLGALAGSGYLSMLPAFTNLHWKDTEKPPGSSVWFRKPVMKKWHHGTDDDWWARS